MFITFLSNMVSKDEFEILDVFKNSLFEEFSIADVMRISKKRSKPWVFNTLKKLQEQNFLTMKRKANINLYSANLNNPVLINSFTYMESQSLINFQHLNFISKIITNVPVKNYCLLIFGSYAENSQKTNSDLDLCFLVENKETEKKIKPFFNDLKLTSRIKTDEHYILFEDFISMLLRNEENLGKQIFKKHKIFFNGMIFYELIKEAHKNGFNE